MGKALSPNVAAQKWANRMASAGEAMKNGVQNVQTAPTEQAAQAKDRWMAGLQRAATEGKFEAGLRRVSLEDWKRSMIDKGVANMQNGARTAIPKVQAFLTEFLPFAESVSQEVASMPKGTIEDSINRSAAAIRKLASFKRTR